MKIFSFSAWKKALILFLTESNNLKTIDGSIKINASFGIEKFNKKKRSLLYFGLFLFTIVQAQEFSDNRPCTNVIAGNTSSKICVRIAPNPTGNANQIKNLLREAGLPAPVLNSRLVNGIYANHIAGLKAVKETANFLANRPATYTGSGTVITQGNLEEKRAAIANNGGTFIFRGTVNINAISKFIQVGSNTTIWIDGTVNYTGPQPTGTIPDQFSVSDVVNGVFEVRGSNSNSKENVKFFGTKRGVIKTNEKCAGIYTRRLNNLVIEGINFDRSRNVLFINNTYGGIPKGNFIYKSARRAIHLKATVDVDVINNLIFEDKVDGIDIDAFARQSEVNRNVICHTGDRLMIWTEIAVKDNLIDSNVGLYLPNAHSTAHGFQENGSETIQPPTERNTYSNNHIFYADKNISRRGFFMHPNRKINRETIVFKNNYTWQSTDDDLYLHDPKPNSNTDVYFYTPGNNQVVDEISFKNAPLEITSNNSYSLTVNYTASTTRDIQVEFWSSTGFIAAQKETVTKGAGSKSITINLPNPPVPGSKYIYKTHIRPLNTNWQQALDTDQINDVNVIPANTQLLQNATYHIVSANSSQRMISRLSDQHNVIMRNPSNFNDQKWTLKHLGDNIYTIQNKSTNRYLEVPNATCENGENVATWTAASNDHQKWKIEKNGDGIYSLLPKHCQEKALDRTDGVLDANIQVHSYSSTNTNQKWRIISLESRSFKGLIDTEELSLKIYPNSANNTITINGLTLGDPIVIYDMVGKVIQKNTASDRKQLLAVSQLRPGLYIIAVPGKNKIKFIKE